MVKPNAIGQPVLGLFDRFVISHAASVTGSPHADHLRDLGSIRLVAAADEAASYIREGWKPSDAVAIASDVTYTVTDRILAARNPNFTPGMVGQAPILPGEAQIAADVLSNYTGRPGGGLIERVFKRYGRSVLAALEGVAEVSERAKEAQLVEELEDLTIRTQGERF